jgi:polar amino acid transport system substrate-binding protein
MENSNSNNTQQGNENVLQTPPGNIPQTPPVASQTDNNPPLQNNIPLTPPVTPQTDNNLPLQNNIPPVKKKGIKNIIIPVVIILIILVGAFLGYSYVKTQHQNMQISNVKTAVKPIVGSNTLTIGVDSTYPPMESINSSGQFVGFDIDMGNMIAKDLGKKAVWKTIVFSNIFNDLNKDDYDIIISSVTITPQREKIDDFSVPYLNAGEVLIVKKTNTSADNIIETAADFDGKKIGVQSGTTDLTAAMKLFPANLVVQYPSNIPALADLQDGKIDAIITDLPDAIGVIQANQDLRIATNPLDKEYYGIVFRKNETQLESQINGILTNFQNEGILQQLTNKWLN